MAANPRAAFLASLAFWIMPAPAPGDDAAIEAGRWSVDTGGLDWACRLVSLEFVEEKRGGGTQVLAFEREGEGSERRWAAARLDRRGVGPPPCRWFGASWTSGGSAVGLQVRPDGPGRLVAIVRERPVDRPGPERVRQVGLVRAAGSGGVGGAKPVAIRFEPDAASSRAELLGVFVAGEDGRDPRAVARPDGFARAASPAWSPDGRRLAFAGFDPTGRAPLIRVVAAEGGPSLAIAAGVSPSWSSDGHRIAYVASGRPDYATDWASLGRNDERIEAVTLAGPRAGEVEVLAQGIYPRWSPTDGRLAFVGRRDANWDVYVRAGDGLDQVRVTDDPALDTQPAWAVDGRSLVFLSDRANRWDLYRAPSDRLGPAIPLTNHARREDAPAPSRDGRRVAFVDRQGRPEASIGILDLDRGTVHAFPEHPDGDRDPAYSPDGRRIAFVSRRACPPEPHAPGRP